MSLIVLLDKVGDFRNVDVSFVLLVIYSYIYIYIIVIVTGRVCIRIIVNNLNYMFLCEPQMKIVYDTINNMKKISGPYYNLI